MSADFPHARRCYTSASMACFCVQGLLAIPMAGQELGEHELAERARNGPVHRRAASSASLRRAGQHEEQQEHPYAVVDGKLNAQANCRAAARPARAWRARPRCPWARTRCLRRPACARRSSCVRRWRSHLRRHPACPLQAHAWRGTLLAPTGICRSRRTCTAHSRGTPSWTRAAARPCAACSLPTRAAIRTWVIARWAGWNVRCFTAPLLKAGLDAIALDALNTWECDNK